MLHFTVATETVLSTSITWHKESQQEELDNSSLSNAACVVDAIAVAETKVGRMDNKAPGCVKRCFDT